VQGYAIYRATSADGPFVRLNDTLDTGVSYVDTSGSSSDIYMVRVVSREVSPEGSYFNPSQGVFVSNFVTQP